MADSIRIARPHVQVVTKPLSVIQARQKAMPGTDSDVLVELFDRIQKDRRRMLDTLTQNISVSKLNYQCVILMAVATYIVLPPIIIYLKATIFLKSWCAKLKFPYLSTALIETAFLIIAFLHIKTCFVLATTSLAAFNLMSCARWLVGTGVPKWNYNAMDLLMTMESRLETKCDSLRLYLLGHLDRLLPPEIEQMQMIRVGPKAAGIAVPDERWEVGPITHRVTEAVNCTANFKEELWTGSGRMVVCVLSFG